MEVYDDRYNNRPIYVVRRTNGLGTAGFILAVLTIVLGWVPVFGWFTLMILFVFALIAAAIGVAGVSSAVVAALF